MPKAATTKPPAPNGAASVSDARALAARLLLRVGQGARLTPVLQAALSRSTLGEQERAFCTELCYGVLRHQAALDAALALHLRRPIDELPPPVRVALRLGAYQLLHLRVPAHAAVGQSVQLVPGRYGRLRALCNAVLRHVAQQPQAPMAPLPAPTPDTLALWAKRYSQPAWFIERLAAQLPADELPQALLANNERPQVMLRIHAARIKERQAIAELAAAGVAAVPVPHVPGALALTTPGDILALPGFARGHYTVQDGAAQLVGLLPELTPGATVLDACAAPGGKTGHLLERLGAHATVVAADRHEPRLQRVQQTAKRLGVSAALRTRALDLTSKEQVAQALGPLGPFSCVLLDAPCSGMGTLRRHPELRQREEASMPALCRTQAALLDALAPLLGEGGQLVYAVCSPLHEEGVGAIAAFLRRHPRFVPVPLADAWAPFAEPAMPGAIATWPHRHGLDAFFAVRLRAGPPP